MIRENEDKSFIGDAAFDDAPSRHRPGARGTVERARGRFLRGEFATFHARDFLQLLQDIEEGPVPE